MNALNALAVLSAVPLVAVVSQEWLPGVVRITDPYDPHPETYHQFIRESVRILDEGEDLCPELASGLLDMIDFRTGERYLLLDGERGPSTPLTDAKKIDRSLDELFAHGRVVAAKAPAPKSTGSATLLVIATSSALALAACWWCLRIFRK